MVFEKREEQKASPKKGSTWVLLILIAVGVLLAVFVIRPGIVGYGVYQQAESSNLSVQEYARNIQQLTRDLEVATTNLSSYSAFTGALLTQVNSVSDELTECKVENERSKNDIEEAQKLAVSKDEEISKLKSEMDQKINDQVTEKTAALEEDKNTCQNSLQSKEKEVGEVQANYDTLVKNMAKSVCCKAKVDNPKINFYDVSDHKIVCLEQGTNQLTC